MSDDPNRDRPGAWRRALPELVLVLATMAWGGTFLAVQTGLAVSGPLFFVGSRFAVAALAAGLIARRALRGLTRAELGAGAAIGVAIFAGYTLQTVGLATITSSQSAFITALYVPLVPLLQWGALGRRPRLASWVGIALAFAGLVLLAGPGAGGLGFGRGEVLTLLGAVAIAAEIILIGRFAGAVTRGGSRWCSSAPPRFSPSRRCRWRGRGCPASPGCWWRSSPGSGWRAR